MERAEIAQRWIEAKRAPGEETLAAVAEVLADDVVTPSAEGKAAVLEGLRTDKAARLYAAGEWGALQDDGELVTTTCTFTPGAPFHRAVVSVRIADGLITEAGTVARALAPGLLDDVIARVWGQRARLHHLPAHLGEQYGVEVAATTRLDNGVARVDLRGGETWVARVFPADRPVASVEGDAEVLRFLAENDYPAERCARADAVSTLAGQGVLITEFVDGKKATTSVATYRKLGDLLGRLHAMPGGSDVVRRESGALHLYTVGGSIREEIETAAACMDSIAEQAAASGFADAFSLVRKHLEGTDDFSDLPRGLVHSDFHPKNTIAVAGGGLVPIDWALAGHGPRVVSLGVLLTGAVSKGAVSPERVRAIVGSYREHITLEPVELERLTDAIRHRQLIFECYGLCLSVAAGKKMWGVGFWSDEAALHAAIAGEARAAFTA